MPKKKAGRAIRQLKTQQALGEAIVRKQEKSENEVKNCWRFEHSSLS